jgi:tRNA pseudouridine(55) synthase
MFHFSDGEIILIDKEINWTSFDVVNYLKPAIQEFEEKKHGIKGKIKIGHAGTLDPLATGLLILCTGKKTKDIQKLMDLRKTYIGTFCLGATTASFDKEQPIHQTFDISSITEEMIHSVTKNFIGKQLQVPPVFSAVRVRGKRAYELVRQNVEVELKVNNLFLTLEKLSAGQRATAMLLILLSQINRILVIDQPEDDLDNRFVFEDVVQVLRTQKGHRQLIVATHNPNIPVLGHAEMVIGLEAQDNRAIIPIQGGIDQSKVQDIVRKVMEGGEEAFRRRAEKYGMEIHQGNG